MRAITQECSELHSYGSVKVTWNATTIMSIQKYVFIKIEKEAAHTTSFTIRPRLLHPTFESLSGL